MVTHSKQSSLKRLRQLPICCLSRVRHPSEALRGQGVQIVFPSQVQFVGQIGFNCLRPKNIIGRPCMLQKQQTVLCQGQFVELKWITKRYRPQNNLGFLGLPTLRINSVGDPSWALWDKNFRVDFLKLGKISRLSWV